MKLQNPTTDHLPVPGGGAALRPGDLLRLLLLHHPLPPLQHAPHHPLHNIRLQDQEDSRELQ